MKVTWPTALDKGSATLLLLALITVAPAPAATPQASSGSKKTAAVGQDKKATIPNTECQALLKSADAASLAGNTGDAEDKYRAALASAEKSQDDKGQLSCQTALANCLAQQTGKLADEGTLRQQSLAQAEKTYGNSSPQYAATLAHLAAWNARNGEIEKARENADRSMQILSNAEDKFPLEMADCFEAVAQRQIAQGTFGTADDSFKKALDLRQSKLPDSNPVMVATCRQYADLLKQLGSKDEANKLNERITLARAMAATNSSSSSSSNSSSSSSSGSNSSPGKNSGARLSLFSKLINDAKTASKAGDNETAVSNAKLAVAEAEKTGGKDGKLPYALVYLGDLYSLKKQPDEAQALYKRALALREESGSQKTLGMARNLERAASCSLRSKDPGEGERLLSKALEIEDETSAPDAMLSDNLQTLLSACMMNKDYSKAEQIAKRLSQVADKLTGPIAEMKKRMATAMLGSVYMQSGRQSEGLAILKSVGGQATPNSADYAKAYQHQSEKNEKLVDESEEAGFNH